MNGPAPASRILLVEDTPALSRLYQQYLAKAGYDPVLAETGAAARAHLAEDAFDLMLLDLELPDQNGMDILRALADEDRAGPPAVVITAHGSINIAVAAMRAGAYDFLVKPFSADRLLGTVKNTLDRARLERLVAVYQQDLGAQHGFIGSSLVMQAVYRIIAAAASSMATVFISGESGTGK